MLLRTLKNEVSAELDRILNFWASQTIDDLNGGFIGQMDTRGTIHPLAIKGEVLNARILWTFSAAYRFTGEERYGTLARRAYTYLNDYFRDKVHRGVYWSVTAAGIPASTRKQVYGVAFALYGISEYVRATQDPAARDFAIALYECIETYSHDAQLGGYWEAFNRDWQPLTDLRLSEKDRNDPKTMNTHLHIIEAYVNLYRAWPQEHLAQRIRDLLLLFETKLLNPATGHLRLFFDRTWQSQSEVISYGHDIEAAWLLLQAAEVLKDKALIQKWQLLSIRMADAASEGFAPDGSLYHEFDPATHHTDTHREWWVSAEGMVGYMNAYQLTHDPAYLERVSGLWQFIKTHLLDAAQGEWRWGVYADYTPMEGDKVGFWKCPYHNVRACMEIIKRIHE